MSEKRMNLRLEEEQSQIVNDNIGLVKYIANKFSIHNHSIDDYDDLVSIGTIGLIKAVLAYDKSKKIKFSTFAVTCIANEIKKHFRKENRNVNNLYLEDEIQFKDSIIKIEDMIEDKKADFIEKILSEQQEVEIINIILNCFSVRSTIILLYRISGLEQEEIARTIGVSQGYVAKILKKEKSIIHKIFEGNIRYDKKIEIVKKNDMYYLILPSISTNNLNILLDGIDKETKNIQYFEIILDKDKIIIKMLAEVEYFFILAKIISMIYK